MHVSARQRELSNWQKSKGNASAYVHDKHTSSSESCVISAAHYARTLLHLLAIPSRLCLTWLRLSLKISNASSVMRGGGGDACVDGNRRDSGGMLHACYRMEKSPRPFRREEVDQKSCDAGITKRFLILHEIMTGQTAPTSHRLPRRIRALQQIPRIDCSRGQGRISD